jgi:N-acetylglucosaminyl-diphospho-decaprenol L-rhamnosyltransferase
MTPRVSVVIVSYGSRESLALCLPSLERCRARVPLEVIIVDNASVDGTAEWVRTHHGWVELIASESNEGFARGVARGTRRARGGLLLVLNPDCEVSPEGLERLLRESEEHPRLAAAAPALQDGSGRPTRSCGRFPTLWSLVCDHLGLASWLPRTALFGGYKYGERPAETLRVVDWASGAALLIPRAAWERVGEFDRDLFMYMEDVDWCRRAAALGLEVRHVPEAVFVHVGQRSSSQVPHETYLHNLRARVHYFRKHHGRRAAGAARAILRASLVAKWIVAVARGGRARARIYALGLSALRERAGGRAAGQQAFVALLSFAMLLALALPPGRTVLAQREKAPPARVAYFYSYMGAAHLDSLAAHGFTRAVVHWITDSLDARGRSELGALTARASSLGMEFAPKWLFQASAHLSERPAGRRYTWGQGVVEPDVPCPLDSTYWANALFGRAEEYLAAAPSLQRVAVDFELLRGSRHHYNAGPCRCASCLQDYLGPAPDLGVRDPVRLAGLHGYQEARLAGLLRPMLESFARRHPGVALEVLDLDLDSFVHRALARALVRAGVPTVDYTECSYAVGASALPAARARLSALGLADAPLIGGLWLKRFAPAAIVPAVRAVDACADGTFVFTTFSLWLDPAKLTGAYMLAGPVADYWSALAQANARP